LSPEYPADNTGKNTRLLEGIDKLIGDLRVKGFEI
jgi:hypothetical protein